jgi:hypothetical protein
MIANGRKLANLNEPLVHVRIGNGFDSKRGSLERARGWKVLQDYMLAHGMITKFEAFWNMININVFVRTPAWLKRILYEKLLRK